MTATLPTYIRKASTENEADFKQLQDYFAEENNGYKIGSEIISGTAKWTSPNQVSYFWLQSGKAEAIVAEQTLSLRPGDVVVIDSNAEATVSGDATFWTITSDKASTTSWVGIHRLEDLQDTSGGCNVGENAFRRLQITWKDEGTNKDNPDGNNILGCHVVYIAEATSRSHYHPVPSRHGGMNQHELYLVLDPKEYGLKVTAEQQGAWTYPEPGNWEKYDFTPLQPGDVMSIKAGVVHRAVDVLACVIAIPGFKPDNEIYVDPEIAAGSNGQSPHNKNFGNE